MEKPRFRHWNIGDVKVTRIIERTDPLPWSGLFGAETFDHIKRYEWLSPHFVSPGGGIPLNIQTFVVTSGGRNIVVDTCNGNDKSRPISSCNNLQTPFLERLTAAGYPPEMIDIVVCTHLHFDHVGWNTRLVDGRWVPTFPNARYLFVCQEWRYCESLLRDSKAEVRHIVDSVQPILGAGLGDFVGPNHRVTDEVRLEPAPGHTPGHVIVHIESRDHHGVITGDVLQHPIQCAEPELETLSCCQPEASIRTRKIFLSRYEDKQILVFGSHFSGPTAGWIIREACSWRFSGDFDPADEG